MRRLRTAFDSAALHARAAVRYALGEE